VKRKFEVVVGTRIACYLKCAHCMCDTIIACINCGLFPALAIFLLTLDYTLLLGTCLYLTTAVHEDL